jgi:uncharacterized protein involved in response to NO
MCRVLGPVAAPSAWALWSGAAALLWTLAFVLFLAAFAPMLWRARVDGRAG